MTLKDVTIGFGITGSFCTFEKILNCMKRLKQEGAEIIPIFSDHARDMDTRFFEAKQFQEEIDKVLGEEHKAIATIQEAEPIGPKGYLDILVIAPCTGNTMAKLANGITDTPVLMAAKAHLRNGKPLLLFPSTNDALGMNFRNIGLLMTMKNIYFVPFGQDDWKKKPTSMVAREEYLTEAILQALDGKQMQPVIMEPKPEKITKGEEVKPEVSIVNHHINRS